MTNEEQEKKKQSWVDGSTEAYRAILMECARNLGVDDPLTKAAALVAERRDALVALRSLCERFDLPSEWSDNLHLADVIEKHVERALAELLEACE